MRYQKAAEVLPEDLVELIQGFIEGGYIYIPKKEEHKKTWGEGTRIRAELNERNTAIFEKYLSGIAVRYLAEEFFLSEKSIQRIVLQEKKCRKHEMIKISCDKE